jgi:small subunit ribosomal protein S6
MNFSFYSQLPLALAFPGLYTQKEVYMRRYETIFIVDSDISDEERAPLFEKIAELIPQQNGLVVEIDQWGTKKLAYEIKKKVRGYYVRLDYCGTGALVDEIERLFNIDERVLKYMTVLLEKNIDLDKIKEEIAAKEAEKQQTEETDEPEAKQEAKEAMAPETDEEGTNLTNSEGEES